MAATDIITLDGVDIRSAPVIGRDCYWPITSLMRRCPPDQVFANMPILMGRWADNMSAPSWLDFNIDIDTTTVTVDGCRGAEVSSTLTSCNLTAPNQRLIHLKSPALNWEQLRNDFCRQRNILPSQLCVFNNDGSLNPGSPYTQDFVRIAMDIINTAMGKFIVRTALKGDDANAMEWDGLYTQLRAGWTLGLTNPCPAYLNTEQAIDWNALCGNPHASGVSYADDVTIAGQTITIWNVVYPVPAGLNLAQFLEDYWFSKVERDWADGYGGVDQWEAHLGLDQARCILNAAACMQPCNLNGEFDQTLRERLQAMRTSGIARFYPSGRVLPFVESRYIEANTVRIGPRSIGGRPTYGLFFDDIVEGLANVPATYGNGTGMLPGSQDALLPLDVVATQGQIESSSFFWDVTKTSPVCLFASLLARAGLLVCSRHLWLRIDNISCPTFVANCDTDLSKNGVPLT